MAEVTKEAQNSWEERARNTFSAERKEDLVVLVLAAMTVVLVWSGLVGTSFFKSLFF